MTDRLSSSPRSEQPQGMSGDTHVVGNSDHSGNHSNASRTLVHNYPALRVGSQWTDERKATLIKLWDEGLSASVIANRLGGLTRNAILGAVHRMGLPKRRTTTVAVRRRVPSLRQASRPSRRWLFGQPNFACEPFTPTEADIAPLYLSIDGLKKATCRYPFGDTAPFSYCGHITAGPLPYCLSHARLCYQPARKR